MPPAVQEACWEVFALTLDQVQVDLLSENYPTWTKPVENEKWRVPHHDLGGGGREWRPFFSLHLSSVLAAGWAHPLALSLTDPSQPSPGRGPRIPGCQSNNDRPRLRKGLVISEKLVSVT